jgi:hypothetical protein
MRHTADVLQQRGEEDLLDRQLVGIEAASQPAGDETRPCRLARLTPAADVPDRGKTDQRIR